MSIGATTTSLNPAAPELSPPQPGFLGFRLVEATLGESARDATLHPRAYRLAWHSPPSEGERDPNTPVTVSLRRPGFPAPVTGLPTTSEIYFTFQQAPTELPMDSWPETMSLAPSAFALKLWRYVLNESLPLELRNSAAELLLQALFKAPDATAVAVNQELPSTLRQALSFLTDTAGQRPMTRISLGRLAQETGVSSHHLCRLFRRHLDLSPLFVHRILRMVHARRLLLATDGSIEDVARALGYSSLNNFRQHFRSVYGVVPSSLRRGTALAHPPETPTGLARSHPLSRYLATRSNVQEPSSH